MTYIDKNTPASEMTIGGNIYDAGNAREFKTGDWRSVKTCIYTRKMYSMWFMFPSLPRRRDTSRKRPEREQILITIL